MFTFRELSTCKNLIPDIVNPSPDYYCTWQTQLFATSDGKPFNQRKCIDEHSMFVKEKPYGWAYFYEKSRKDLIFIMDDSWDVPLDGNTDYYGSLILNPEKFPSFTIDNASPEQALKLLTNKIKQLGWKGLGGWVCAQESSLYPATSEDEYWIERMKCSERAGFVYWKVDWGKKCQNIEFRKKLSELSRRYAPTLIIENSMIKDVIPYSDVYRTYDVPAIMSIPMTFEKMQSFLNVDAPKDGFMGIINCEDEAYIAASLGCAMGIMRNPYIGNLPNGKPDPSFPDIHRRIKTKAMEITRAVNWHKIAPAFGADKNQTYYSDTLLTDSWSFNDKDAEIEAWWFETDAIKNSIKDDVVFKSACSAISRGMKLPEVTPDDNGDIPFISASKNPNGAVSVAACGRTRDRMYFIPKCSVTIDSSGADTFGVFGEYKELIVTFEKACLFSRVLAQDLAGDQSYDITELVYLSNDRLVISGELIREIGTSEQDGNDTSEPGLLIKLI